MNTITFNVNNGRKLTFTQYREDGYITVSAGTEANMLPDSHAISPGDFVMLWNLYRYIKDNDIQNDWINPNGKN